MWYVICVLGGLVCGFVICTLVSVHNNSTKVFVHKAVKALKDRADVEARLLSEDKEYSEYHDGKSDGIKVAIELIRS